MMLELTTPRVDAFHCFPGQHPDERAVIFARHHWLFTLLIFVQYVMALIIPLLLLLVLAFFQVHIPAQWLNLVLFLACWYALGATWMFYLRWMKEYFDYVVITTERLVDVDQIGLFEQKMSETSLSEIQDVSHHVRGFWGTVFGYGDLKVQTAGEKGLFEMYNLAHPVEIRSQVLMLRDRFVERLQTHAFEDALLHQKEETSSGG